MSNSKLINSTTKTYSYKKNKKISKHFYSNEFASTNGVKLYDDKILINEGLVNYLEKFFDYGITSIVISSGYRTPSHSVAVGGSSKDAHTYGLAADIVGYVNNNKVPTEYMVCFAELIGFSGIGIINYTGSIHVDVRTKETYSSGHWFGNERTGEDDISSFFTYFKLSKDDVIYKYNKKPESKKKTKKETKISITYQVWDDVYNKWLPNVIDKKDYAGIFGHDVCAVKANLSSGDIWVRVHYKGGSWLSAVKNRSDYAGLYNKPIDAITMKTNTGKTIHYRVHIRSTGKWSSWMTKYGTSSGKYAGTLGKEIDGIQIYLD